MQTEQCVRTRFMPKGIAMLKGKVAVVTGSTSGIGLGIARQLAGAGADIMLNGFGEAADIEKLRKEIAAAHGIRVAYSGADLSKAAAVTGLIEQATREPGRVDEPHQRLDRLGEHRLSSRGCVSRRTARSIPMGR